MALFYAFQVHSSFPNHIFIAMLSFVDPYLILIIGYFFGVLNHPYIFLFRNAVVYGSPTSM